MAPHLVSEAVAAIRDNEPRLTLIKVRHSIDEAHITLAQVGQP